MLENSLMEEWNKSIVLDMWFVIFYHEFEVSILWLEKWSYQFLISWIYCLTQHMLAVPDQLHCPVPLTMNIYVSCHMKSYSRIKMTIILLHRVFKLPGWLAD